MLWIKEEKLDKYRELLIQMDIENYRVKKDFGREK